MKALWIPTLVLLATVATGCASKDGMMKDEPMSGGMLGYMSGDTMMSGDMSDGMTGDTVSGDGMMHDDMSGGTKDGM